MELNWTTFFLETVNFLVLVWILERLFYKPVRKIIADRRVEIEKKLQDAVRTRTEAEGLRLKYENRLKDWAAEKASEQEVFQKGLEAEKERRLKQLEGSLQQERERIEAKEKKRIEELLERDRREAVRQSLAFLSRLLQAFASPAVEDRIVALSLRTLQDGKSAQAGLLRSGGGKEVSVWSAFDLSEGQKRGLTESFKALFQPDVRVQFGKKPELLAGLEVACGSVVLQANLRDELSAFAEASRHD